MLQGGRRASASTLDPAARQRAPRVGRVYVVAVQHLHSAVLGEDDEVEECLVLLRLDKRHDGGEVRRRQGLVAYLFPVVVIHLRPVVGGLLESGILLVAVLLAPHGGAHGHAEVAVEGEKVHLLAGPGLRARGERAEEGPLIFEMRGGYFVELGVDIHDLVVLQANYRHDVERGRELFQVRSFLAGVTVSRSALVISGVGQKDSEAGEHSPGRHRTGQRLASHSRQSLSWIAPGREALPWHPCSASS